VPDAFDLCHYTPGRWVAEMELANAFLKFTDDQRLDTIRALGNDQIHTPIRDDRRVLRNPHKRWYWHYIDQGYAQVARIAVQES